MDWLIKEVEEHFSDVSDTVEITGFGNGLHLIIHIHNSTIDVHARVPGKYFCSAFYNGSRIVYESVSPDRVIKLLDSTRGRILRSNRRVRVQHRQ